MAEGVRPVDGAIAGIVAAGVALGVGELVCGVAGQRPDADHIGRHAVHRPLRRVPEGPRHHAVRHERQAGADRRHRHRVPGARGVARHGVRAPAVDRRRRVRRVRRDRALVVPREPPRRGRRGVTAAVLATAAGIATLFGLLHLLRIGGRRAAGEQVDTVDLAAAVPDRRRVARGARRRARRARSPLRRQRRGRGRAGRHEPAPSRSGARHPSPCVDSLADTPGLSQLHHAERRLLPHRHRAHRPAGRRRRLDRSTIDGHGRPGGVVHLRRAGGDGRLRRHGHAAVRLERGRRQPRRQRHVAGRAAAAAARRGRRQGRGDADRRPVRRRLHRRLPDRGRPRRPHGDGRGGDERRAVARDPRLPGSPRRRRAVRLRVGDEVAPTAISLTTWDEFDGYWIARGWAKEGPIKPTSRIDVPRSGATARSRPAGDRRRRVAADHRHRRGRGAGRRRPVADRPDSATPRVATRGCSGTSRGTRRPASTGSGCAATNDDGEVQTEEHADPAPDGATGWHTRTVQVR